QGGGGIDYFFLQITADANVTTGIHNVRIITDGGTSNDFALGVNGSQPPPSPTPGSSPVLSRITPSHIGRDPFVSLPSEYIKFEGSGFTGFGIYREVVVDNYPQLAITLPTYEANPDTIAVGVISTAVPDTSLTVRVHNLTND